MNKQISLLLAISILASTYAFAGGPTHREYCLAACTMNLTLTGTDNTNPLLTSNPKAFKNSEVGIDFRTCLKTCVKYNQWPVESEEEGVMGFDDMIDQYNAGEG